MRTPSSTCDRRAGRFARLGHDLVEIGRARLFQRSFGRQQFAGKLIERLVLGQAFANPAIISVGPLLAQNLPIDAQQVGPFQGPVIGELGPIQQFVDQQVALVRPADRPGNGGLRRASASVPITSR